MPSERTLPQSLQMSRIVHQPMVMQAQMLVVVAPLFTATEVNKLRNRKAQVKSTDGKRWTTLEGWLEASPGNKDVVCRKTGLQIELRRRRGLASAVQVLPFTGGTPKAVLSYRFEGEVRKHTMKAVMDTRRKLLSLVLPFADPEASAAQRSAGLELYGELVTALSEPDGIDIQLSYAHTYRKKVTRTGRPRVPGRRPSRLPQPRTPAVRVAPSQPRRELRVNPQPRHLEIRPELLSIAAQPRINPNLMRNLTIARRPTEAQLRKVGGRHKAPKPRPTETEKPGTTKGSITFEVQRPQNHPSAYPDLLRAGNNGWGHVRGPSGATLHFRDTERPDTFHFLPTTFKLGYHVEQDGATGRPPLRPEYYRDGDRHRVKVTLVAVPGIADEDRTALAKHLRDTVLSGTLPFVRLAPASGLTTEFLPTFTTRSVDGQQTLPAGIVFRALEVDLDDRVLLEFDMGAAEYGIFAELLRHGLHGTATIVDSVQESVPVRLELDDMVSVCRVLPEAPGDGAAPGLYVWSEEVEADDEDDPPGVRLSLVNRLEHPLRLESLRAGLLDSGPVAGMIFDAEEVSLSRGVTLAARGHAGGKDRLSKDLSPRRIAVWDETVPLVGETRVEGGTPEEWLEEVHQDPSLTTAEIVLDLDRVTVSDDDRLQIVRLRLLEAGSTAPRESLELPASERQRAWPLRLTLGELAGDLPDLFLEYDCVTVDGEISLPQRLAVDLVNPSTIVLRPVIARPESVFTIESAAGERRDDLDLEAASRRIEELRGEGVGWKVFARVVEVPEPGAGETGSGGAEDGEDPASGESPTGDPGGAPVKVITDLLTVAFTAGELSSVFVTLQPAGEGAQTTFAIEADDAGERTWIPAAEGVPPFHYRVTYLYADGRPPKRVEGTEASPVLVLDPEA